MSDHAGDKPIAHIRRVCIAAIAFGFAGRLVIAIVPPLGDAILLPLWLALMIIILTMAWVGDIGDDGGF